MRAQVVGIIRVQRVNGEKGFLTIFSERTNVLNHHELVAQRETIAIEEESCSIFYLFML